MHLQNHPQSLFSRELLVFASTLSCVRSSIAILPDSLCWRTLGLIWWYQSSAELVSRELHGNETVIGSYNPSVGVQRRRTSIVDQDRPLDHDPDRSSSRHPVCGRYHYAAAADIYSLARALYLLSPSDCITGTKRDAETNSASTFQSLEGMVRTGTSDLFRVHFG